MDLKGSVALVTGASSGIGRQAALALAQQGARVVAAGRDEAALADVARRCGGRALPVDLARPGEPERAGAEALESEGRVDILVNNAGIGWAGLLAEMDPGTVDELVQVNVLAPIHLTLLLLEPMLERRRGHIVNVASIAGHVGVGDEAVYAATKAALISFTESLRYELSGYGVGVSLVTPGAVRTAFFDRRGRPYTRAFPPPIDPVRVGRAVVRAVKHERAEVFVPGWMAFPARLRGAFPGLYRALARRLG